MKKAVLKIKELEEQNGEFKGVISKLKSRVGELKNRVKKLECSLRECRHKQFLKRY